MQKKTEMVEQILAEALVPLSQRSYSDVRCKTPTQLHHTTTSGEILDLLLLTPASEQAEVLPCCATP